MQDARALLPIDPAAQRQQVQEALTWLVEHLDRPHIVAARCAELGPALAELGVPPQRLEALGLLMIDTMRANLGPQWRPEHEAAWSSALTLAARWMGEGMQAAYAPAFWSAVVVEHERRWVDAAVLRLWTYLPYPCLPGQRAVVESALFPQRWRECWVGNLPELENVVELQVRLHRDDPVGAALVERTAVGSRLRLRRAVGTPVLDGQDGQGGQSLLLIAEHDGIAPVRAALRELRRLGDRRGVHVFWPAGSERDLYALVALAPEGTTVVRDRFTPGEEDWSAHDVFVTGPAATVSRALEALATAGVPTERIRAQSLG